MKGSQLLDKMELIHPAYIDAAEKRPPEKKKKGLGWSAIAACLCLSLALIFLISHYREPLSDLISREQKTLLNATPEPPGADHPQASGLAHISPSAASEPTSGEAAAGLPSAALSAREKITIPDLVSGGMGFEGYSYHDISELKNGNPWSEEMKLKSLPVYKSGIFDPDGLYTPKGLTLAEMEEILHQAAAHLGFELLSTEEHRDGYMRTKESIVKDETSVTSLEGSFDQGSLEVRADGSITCRFSGEGLDLPEELSMTYSRTDDAQAEKTLAWLSETYADFLAFDKAEACSWGDFNIYNEFNRRYEFFEAAGDDTQKILNYNFRRAGFAPGDTGKLISIRKNDDLTAAEKMGDYPLISVEEARTRLINGHYQTSVPVEFPGEDAIAKVELIYRTGGQEEVFLPYYRFYVLLPSGAKGVPPEENETGLKNYGAYYVPALSDDDVKNMPTYDGHFN